MCLSHRGLKKHRPTMKEVEGYKVVCYPTSPFVTTSIPVFIPLDSWVEDPREGRIWVSRMRRYTTGFHFFKTLRGARRYSPSNNVVKVKARRIVASGFQDGCRAMVARQIKVISGVIPRDEKKP